MKIAAPVRLPVLLLIASTAIASAQFTGLDDFSGAIKNTAKWGEPLVEGSGLLSMSGDGVVRYSSSGGPVLDRFMAWPWIVGHAPFNKNWSAQADVHVPVIPIPAGNTAIGMGIAVLNSADPEDNFTSALENYRTGSNPVQAHHFFSSFDVNGDSHDEIFSPATGASAAVRLSWDAGTQTLTASFDPDGAIGGYVWTPYRSVQPALPANWDMDGSETFQLAIFGYSEETDAVLADNLFIDNFYLLDDSTPVLDITRNGNQLDLCWSRLALGYALKSSATLNADWTPVAGSPTVAGDKFMLSLPLASVPPQFFRLEK